ncbi:MAG: hypothetical protein DRJ03_01995 [Chloroflexi bacterium]|nr:MAG: hypothetical protein DRJ03_01995 [Chloroflexota bacterium]
MTEYLVVWKIELTADSPQEAAAEALKIHRDAESYATVFDVVDMDTGKEVRVDTCPRHTIVGVQPMKAPVAGEESQ